MSPCGESRKGNKSQPACRETHHQQNTPLQVKVLRSKSNLVKVLAAKTEQALSSKYKYSFCDLYIIIYDMTGLSILVLVEVELVLTMFFTVRSFSPVVPNLGAGPNKVSQDKSEGM